MAAQDALGLRQQQETDRQTRQDSATAADASLPLSEFLITVEGESFVYKMVRNMVGAIVSAGAVGCKPSLRGFERGWLHSDDLPGLIQARDRSACRYPTAPAHGLWLTRTMIPSLDPSSDFMRQVREDWQRFAVDMGEPALAERARALRRMGRL